LPPPPAPPLCWGAEACCDVDVVDACRNNQLTSQVKDSVDSEKEKETATIFSVVNLSSLI
jgi:hypothetical protein